MGGGERDGRAPRQPRHVVAGRAEAHQQPALPPRRTGLLDRRSDQKAALRAQDETDKVNRATRLVISGTPTPTVNVCGTGTVRVVSAGRAATRRPLTAAKLVANAGMDTGRALTRPVITRSRSAALAALCALVCATTALAWANGAFAEPAGGGSTQGNPQGVRMAEGALAAFSRIPAFTYNERGFFQLNTVLGRTRSISYYYGYGALRSGFVWASEHATVALHDDQVMWWRDDLTPSGGGAVPVELVANSRGVFSAFGDAAHHSCFNRVQGSVPYPYGGAAYSSNGRYLNGTSPLRSVYRWWQTEQLASESDVIAPSGLITSGRVSVAAGSGLAGFSVNFSNAFPSTAGPAPQVNLCG